MEPYEAGSSPASPGSWTYPPPVGEPVYQQQAWPAQPPQFVAFSPPPRSSRRVRPVLCVLVAFAVLTAVAGVLHLVDVTVFDQQSGLAQAVVDPSPVASAARSALAATPADTIVAARGRFRSTASHLQIRFPDSQLTSRGPFSVPAAGTQFTLTIVTDPASALVAEVERTPTPIPAAARSAFFSGVQRGLTRDGHLQQRGTRALTFHGGPAERFRFITTSGKAFEAVTVIYPHGWTYTLLGPSGTAFKHFERSFRHL